MESPTLFSLPLNPDYVSLIRSGKKTATVRRGRLNPPLGPAQFDTGEQIVPIQIIRLTYCAFGELNTEDALRDGFSSAEELITVLRSFYPDITEGEEITILTFRPV